MRLKTLHLKGFKGVKAEIELGTRDLLVADNRLGKTAVVQAIAFLATGKVPGMKSEDRIDLVCDGIADVTGEFVRENGTTFSFTRGLTFEEGRLSETFEIVPSGGEASLKKANARLESECESHPFAIFDLPGFLGGNEENRLKMLMSLCGDNERTFHDAVGEHVFEFPMGMPHVVDARQEILNIPFKGNVIDGCEFYAEVAKNRAGEHRKEATRLENTIRELGHVGMEDLVKASNFLETVEEDLKEARESLQEQREQRAAASQRREEIASIKGRLSGLQMRAEAQGNRIAEKEHAGAEADRKLAIRLTEVENAKAAVDEEKAAHAEKMAEAEKNLDDAKAALQAAREDLRLGHLGVSQADSEIRRIAGQVADLEKQHREAILTAVRWREKGSGSCPSCHRDGLTEEMCQRLATEADACAQEILGHIDHAREEGVLADETKVRAEEQISILEGAISLAEEKVSAADQALMDVEEEMSQLLSAVERAGHEHEVASKLAEAARAALDEARGTLEEIVSQKRELTVRMSEVSDNLPKDVEDASIEGAVARVQEIERKRDEARDIRRRHEDQEKLRVGLKDVQAWVEAFEFWQKALKLFLRETLEKMSASVFDESSRLVEKALGEKLTMDFVTARGKPGLTIRLSSERGNRRWPALSGAEQSVVGLALALAMTSKVPPLILTAECEAMSGETQATFLAAVSSIVPGNIQLLFTTHHDPAEPNGYATNTEWRVVTPWSE